MIFYHELRNIIIIVDVGEQYYSPLTDYVKRTEERGHHPGALTFSERLHYKWAVDRNNTSSQSNYRSDEEGNVVFYLEFVIYGCSGAIN